MTLTGRSCDCFRTSPRISRSRRSRRLFISRNTVKTEAVSIYRKLSAASRSEAVERAVEVGLLDSSIYPPQVNFTSEGEAPETGGVDIWPAKWTNTRTQLRRLAVHDEALLDAISVDGSPSWLR